MLMFESSIFASFIPQILMLVSYLSCLLIPGLHLTPAKADIPVKYIVITQQEVASVPVAIVNYVDFAQQAVISDTVKVEPLFCFISQKLFPLSPHPLAEFDSFRFLSRPPPFFC